MMLRILFATSSSLLGGDHQHVVRRIDESHEVGRAPASWARDPLGGTALVDTEPALHPVEAAAAPLGFREERRHPLLRIGMVLLDDVPAMNRVGVRRLLRERDAHGA